MNALFFNVINKIFNLIELSIFIEVILSWIPNIRENDLTRFIYRINEPFLKPGRYIQDKILPNLMIDFSPIIALLMVNFIKNILITILYKIL